MGHVSSVGAGQEDAGHVPYQPTPSLRTPRYWRGQLCGTGVAYGATLARCMAVSYTHLRAHETEADL
eukprot:1577970-Rhodomonas_salina.1